MEFEQKAEEKKMSMSKNIARLAVTAGLTAALSFGGVMAPVTMAFAEDGATGSITINKVDDANKDNTFKAYQIFKAKVIDAQDGSGKIASDVKWAVDDQAQKDIITAIKGTKGYSDSKSQLPTEDPITAQDVADWLSANVTTTTASANGVKGTRVAPGDVLYSIAKAVINNETAVGNSIKAGNSWTCSNDGYYLFVSDGLTDTTKPNTGTSPIFAIVGGNPVTVTEKTSIPTVDKQILDDTADTDAANAEEDNWKNSGDAWIGQDIDYRLTGHVADNIASYNTYYYEFQDTLSKGLKVVKNPDGSPNGLHVYIVDNGGKKEVAPDAENGYTATVTPGETELLNVSFKNLKTVQTAKGEPIEVGAASKVVVTYKAQLTSDVEYKAVGTTNEVKLVYSNNPMTNDKGTSEPDKVTDYVFGLDVTKTDADPKNVNAKLVAGFKVKMIKEGDKQVADGGQWLTADGGLTTEVNKAGEFKTETNNKVFIPGLVEGTYEISETTTPSGYNTIAPFQITVKPTYDTAGNLTGLTVSDTSNMVDSEKTNASIDSTKIPVTIKNKKGSGLPLTGLNGVTFTWIAGGAVLCIGVAHLIRSRKQAEESEQE